MSESPKKMCIRDRLEGAASLLEMLEDKADNRRITASELAAVRCIVETCAANLDGVLELSLIHI